MSRTSMSHPMSTVATLFAGPGSAANVSGSVHENVGFRFVLDRTVRTLSANGIPDSGLTSGLLFVPSLEAADPCSVLAADVIPQNVTRYEDILQFGHPAIGIAPWLSVACTQSFLAATRRAESDALLFFKPFNNESGIPPPATDGFWDLKDGDQWKEDNRFPVYAIPGPAAETLMRELAWFSNGRIDRSQNESYPSIQKRDSSIRLFTMIANETQEDSWPLWIVVAIVLAGIIALVLTIWCTWSAISRKLSGQIPTQRRRRHQGPQGDIESIPMNRRPVRILSVVPPEAIDLFPHYIYGGPTSSSAVSLVKGEIETHVAELDLNNQSLEPRIEETHVETPQHVQHTEDGQDSQGAQEAQETNQVVGIRRPTPAMINAHRGIVVAVNPYRTSLNHSSCAICHEDYELGITDIRELPCGHIFDSACIDEWLLTRSVRCPLCQAKVITSGEIQIVAP